jgi:GTP-binding protein LepA
VQAQTVANFWSCFERGLQIIPVINKIDLPDADPARVRQQLVTIFQFNYDDAIEVCTVCKPAYAQISAKVGTNIDELMSAIIARCPPPSAAGMNMPFRALLVDSWFVQWRGAIALLLVKDGCVSCLHHATHVLQVRVGDAIMSIHTGKQYVIGELGVLRDQPMSLPMLNTGQIGARAPRSVHAWHTQQAIVFVTCER